jgi:fatty acid desaturase
MFDRVVKFVLLIGLALFCVLLALMLAGSGVGIPVCLVILVIVGAVLHVYGNSSQTGIETWQRYSRRNHTHRQQRIHRQEEE